MTLQLFSTVSMVKVEFSKNVLVIDALSNALTGINQVIRRKSTEVIILQQGHLVRPNSKILKIMHNVH